MRIVLFAPTSRSLYSRLVAHELVLQANIELVGIYVRRLWSYKRIRTDLRREGPRLLQKIFTKLILPEDNARQAGNHLSVLADEKSMEAQDLADFSRSKSVPYYRVRDFNAEVSEASIRDLAPDLIVFTGGGLIRKNILAIPSIGVLNCHSGLLPRYRGMDTLEWSILEAQDTLPRIGLTLHFMDAGVDTGPILRHYQKQLQSGEDLVSIRQRLEPEMVRLVIEGVRDLQRGALQAQVQNSSEGRQYYVIHPRLQERAARKLQRTL
jgi:folate-dependent phosphoribosylglycinamide formyltransferase PurN